MRDNLIPGLSVAALLLFLNVTIYGQTMEQITKDKILAKDKEWQEKYDKYAPAADMISALKSKLGDDLKITVYLGLWCPDSRNNVPPFLKIMDLLGTGAAVQYFDVPRKASRDVKYYVEDLKVERVPTFIFYREGKEIGRIVERPKTGMIEDFMEIMFK